jgi:2-keto-4-pentenoate hydratase/2-oxohepta-3-ene-1,7-dioic acid hydratase in catechol pathway
MKIVRFLYKGQPKYGIVEEDVIYLGEGDIYTNLKRGEKVGHLKDFKLLAPCEPTKIVCSRENYKEVFKAMKLEIFKHPYIFLKPTTALLNPLEKIIMPSITANVNIELELVIVVKSKARNIKEEDAHKYILGYTIGNDITDLDLQLKDGWPGRSKYYDTFAPLGPMIVTDLDTSNLSLKTRINGQTVHDSNTSNMVFSPFKLLSFTSSIMTLLPGDVIYTGTPQAWGPVKPDDVVEMEIEKIGILKNVVNFS